MAAGDLPLLLGEDRSGALRIRDLSSSGVSFYSEEPLNVMTRVRFAIEFPREGQDAALAAGEGVVVRCERVAAALAHFEVAVFFSHLEGQGAEWIRGWVEQHLTREEQH